MSDLVQSVERLDPKKRRLLEALLEREGVDLERSLILPLPRDGRELPLSFSQERLWFLAQLDPESAAYNVPTAVRLDGPLRVCALAQAFTEIRRRHEVLRTVFPDSGGRPRQEIQPPGPQLLQGVDLSALDPEDRERETVRLTRGEARRPFDLARGPLMRTAILRRAPGEHALLLDLHHVVSDAWSSSILIHEATRLYGAFRRGAPSPLEELTVQYADFAAWQRRWLSDRVLEEQLDYWRARLDGMPPLQLAPDRGDEEPRSSRGGRVALALDATLTGRLKRLGREEGATLFMVLLAAFQLLLSRIAGQRDVAVGSPIANRRHAEVEGLIGMFLNTLVLRTDVGGSPTFRQLLRRVREGTEEAYAHQDLPFEKLVEELEPERDLHRHPFFDVLVNYTNTPRTGGESQGLEIAPLGLEEPESKFAMTLYAEERGDRLTLDLVHRRDLFSGERARILLHQLRSLLGEAAERPDDGVDGFSLVTAETRPLLPDPTRPLPEPPVVPLPEAFRRVAAEHPDDAAIRRGGREQSYAELAGASRRLAVALRARGLRKGDVVAVTGLPSFGLVAAMLGSLESGGVLLPLDPNLPEERRRHMLHAAEVRVILDLGTGAGDLEAAEDDDDALAVLRVDPETGAAEGEEPEAGADAPPLPAPADPAYVFFTSGTTGRPKGVLGRHAGLGHFLAWQRDTFGIGSGDRGAQLTALSFDVVLRDVFLPLVSGACLCLPPAGVVPSGPEVPAWMDEDEVTFFHTVPAIARSWLDAPRPDASLARVRWIFFAGEPLTGRLVRRWREAFPGAGELVNLYGPTETTLARCFHRVPDEPDPGVQPVGEPLPDTQALVLGDGWRPCGVGEPGEIVLRTPLRTFGYLGGEETFVPSPFTQDPEDLLYRTGDLGRFRPDGRLEILGRVDHQVKIRGVRVEPAEVAAVLEEHPGVASCVVVGVSDEARGTLLVAYHVRAQGADLSPGELSAHLHARLPAAMVPSVFMPLDALPLTPNGKVDRSALPAPDLQALGAERPFVPPTGPTEEALAGIFSDLLGTSPVSADASFFELGGHSLLAIRLRSAVAETFGVDVTLKRIFEAPTVAGLAAEIAGSGSGDGAPAPSLPTLTAAPEELHEPFPLTPIQEAYWFGRTEGVELGNVASHRYLELDLAGLDVARFERAWNRLVERHDMLRAVVTADGWQRILPEVPQYEVEVIDLRTLPAEEADRRAEEVRQEMSHHVPDASRWPLFDIRACRTGGEAVRLHLSFDYLIADAWSFRILIDELLLLYREPEALLEPLEASFRDYVLALQEIRRGELHERSLAYWDERLPTLPPAPDLPLAKTPAEVEHPRFVRRAAEVDAASWRRLKEWGARSGLTPSGLLLAAFGEVLSAWSKDPRFCVVLTLFNRLPLHPQVDRLVGDFTSTTLLEIDASERAPFRERARAVQERLWSDLDHSHVSGVEVLRRLARAQGRGLRASMPVVFTSTLDLDRQEETAPADPLDLGDPAERERGHSITQTPQVWLDHGASEERGALVLVWDAVEDLFPAGMLDRMFDAYRGILEHLAGAHESWEEPVPCLTPAEELALRARINDTAAPLPTGLLQSGFFERAAEAPERPAVIDPRRTLSYGEVATRARALARRLRAAGVGPGRLVAVAMEKGWEQVVGVLAVLEAGGAYLPVSPDLPEGRVHHLLERGQANVVLTVPRLDADLAWPPDVERFPVSDDDGTAVEAADPLEPVEGAEELAYVIFTSGSTGLPKGVMIDHRGAANTVADVNRRFAVGPEDRVLALSSLSFDLSVYDVFGTLAAGGALVLPSPGEARDPATWARRMGEHGVTVWNSVPALMEMLTEYLSTHAERRPEALRLVMMSGDWIPVSLPDRLRAQVPGVEVVSLGGATEASIWSILHPIGEVGAHWTSIPYGRPMDNQTFHVLDGKLEPRPVWVPGELYIGGVGVALGYWRDRERTEAAFLTHPETGERLYRTGDWGRYLPGGDIEFLGREDTQVKIQGYRVELGEVEAALVRCPGVRDAVAVAPGERQRRSLLAHVVPQDPGDPADPERVRAFLADTLPAYMVPKEIVLHDAFPLTANGKVDRNRLAGTTATPSPTPAREAPAQDDDPLVQWVRELLKELLEREDVDLGASLIELGASSVDLVRIANRLEDELGFRPGMEELFHQPVESTLARYHRKTPKRQVERTEERAPAETGGGPVWTPIRDPEARERFRRGQPGLRAPHAGAPAVRLARPGVEESAYLDRRSRREFAETPLAAESLGALLGVLRQMSWRGEPKYRYGSAGGLYPVQLYVYPKPGRVDGLDPGFYYYHPVEHTLHPLSPEARLDRRHYGWINRPVFDGAAFALFLVGRLSAIGPLYGELSRDLCLVEAGLMTQLLETEAPHRGIGLCQIGRMEFDRIRPWLYLDPDHRFLHGLLGGPLAPEDRSVEPLAEPTATPTFEEGEL